MKKKKWELAAMTAVTAFLMLGTKAEAMNNAYRMPQLSGVTKTWVYQGETSDQNWERMLADDQEDGDLTSVIKSSGSVNTSKTGTYVLSRSVTDSDQHTAALDTQVTVLDRNASEEEKSIQRILYTLPDASHLTGIGFNRGYYHDRQNLGLWMPHGSSLQIRIVNAEEFQQDLTVQFKNDDSQTESSATIPKDGSWVTLSNTFTGDTGEESADSVPFITTPKNTAVQPVIEYRWTDDLKEIPYYRYGDSQQAFFDSWDKSQAPFAIIEGSAATFLVPICDRNNILNSSYGNKKEVYRFKTLDEMLDWYASFVKQYDAYSGLDYYAEDPWNQDIRAKFFIKANAHGAGQAYYTTDHSAYNGKSLQTYLVKDWISLHEFGHGYEGAIASQENPFVETTNNILGYYFEPTYRPAEDFGWLLGEFSGTKSERYAQLGNRMKESLASSNTFADIVSDPWHYNVSLYMFTNLMDKLGPQQAVSAMHSHYREVYYKTGKKMGSSDALAESLDSLDYNVLPYFASWHILPSGRIADQVYAMDKPMIYYLKELIPDDAACEKTRVALGLDGIYSLVSTDDLADTGYTSKVRLNIQIDDLTQIKGKTIRIKNGSKIVKEVILSSGEIQLELPVGIYELEMPLPKETAYQYDNEYLIASAGNVSKTVSYTRQTGNPLADDMQIQMLGLGDASVASVKIDTNMQKLTWTVNSTTPHFYLDGTYISIRVLDPDGNELLNQSLQANEKADGGNFEIDFKTGSTLILYHREARGRQRFVSSYTGESLEEYQLAAADQTATYRMTDKGLMQDDWSKEKQMQVYLQSLEQYSAFLMSHITKAEIADSEKYHNEKTTLLLAYEKLDQAAADNYRNSYGILIGQKPEVSYGYTQIAPEHLKGSADSEHPGEEASLAVDGKKDTIWHSNYGNGTKADIAGNKNNTYTILLDQKTDIGKLTYLPRQTGNNNGIILKYELSYSQTEDGDDFQIIPLADNTWANNRTEKSVSLDLADVRRIRIRALSTAGTPADTYISAAQFSLYEKYSIYDKHTYLSDLYQTPDENGNTVKENANADGTAITLKTNEKERTFEKGIGMRSGDTAVWDISGLNSDALSLWIGMNKKGTSDASVQIYGDGTLLYTSVPFNGSDNAISVYLDITGVKILKFCADGKNGSEQIALADVMLENQKDKETLNLKVGDQAVFLRNTSLTPEDRGKATFVSSDPSVATVNERGVVTAHSTGSATIQVKFGSNETVVCKVTVTEKPKKKEPETPDTENRIPSVSDRPETPESGNTRPSQKIPSVGSVKKLNGVHYTVTKTSAKGGTAEVTKITGKKRKITIASEVKINGFSFKVTSVRKNAAKNNKKISTLTIGKNIISIGANSFSGCKNLKNITLKGTKSIKIKAKALAGTSRKIKITVPKKISARTLKKLKKNLQKTGISKKAVYQKK